MPTYRTGDIYCLHIGLKTDLAYRKDRRQVLLTHRTGDYIAYIIIGQETDLAYIQDRRQVLLTYRT